jgi:hypothetical protein
MFIELCALLADNEDAPEEEHEQLVDNGILLESFLNAELAFPHLLQKINQNPLHLGAAQSHSVVVVESRSDYLELWVLNDIIDLLQILLIVAVFTLVDDLEQLEVEYDFMGVRVALEYFDLPVIVEKVFIEKSWIGVRIDEELLTLPVVVVLIDFKFAVSPPLLVAHFSFHSEYYFRIYYNSFVDCTFPF